MERPGGMACGVRCGEAGRDGGGVRCGEAGRDGVRREMWRGREGWCAEGGCVKGCCSGVEEDWWLYRHCMRINF